MAGQRIASQLCKLSLGPIQKRCRATALELGHHDSRITFAHYRELVKPKEAERYWNIRPAAEAKVVQMPVRRAVR
jgi:hypothetical protein